MAEDYHFFILPNSTSCLYKDRTSFFSQEKFLVKEVKIFRICHNGIKILVNISQGFWCQILWIFARGLSFVNSSSITVWCGVTKTVWISRKTSSQLGRIINGFLTFMNKNGNWRIFSGEIETLREDFTVVYRGKKTLSPCCAWERIKSASFSSF